jgi:hypothetical protein
VVSGRGHIRKSVRGRTPIEIVSPSVATSSARLIERHGDATQLFASLPAVVTDRVAAGYDTILKLIRVWDNSNTFCERAGLNPAAGILCHETDPVPEARTVRCREQCHEEKSEH